MNETINYRIKNFDKILAENGKINSNINRTLIMAYEDSIENIGYCDCHYKGEICPYDGLPASPECTFKYYGVCSILLTSTH